MAVLQRSDFGGDFIITGVTIDLANHTAVASVDTVLTVAGIKSTDIVVARAPATLEAGIAVVCCHTVIDGGFTLRTTNASAGAINPASASWDFLVFRR